MPPRRLLRRTVTGLVTGIATGLFLGDTARVFQAGADVFVRLLQMAVLPYVTVSIIGSVGALRLADLRTLGLRAALVLPGLWLLALTVAFVMPLTFPPTEHAAFFSTTLLEPPPSFDVVSLYIPANPFFALANNVVPAVVLFSLVIGVALIGLPQKQVLLDILQAASDTLARAMQFVVRLTPYGVFAIAASTAGTLRIEQARQLEVYLIAYAAFALLLGLWVLPQLIGACTPIPARDVFAAVREPLLTAVVAGDLFIVLPALIEACRDLVARHDSERAGDIPAVLVPVSFNLPHSGKLLSMTFVLFAGWFSGSPIDVSDYPRLALTSVVTLFGSITAAMPFLLDQFRVPADTFQLFIASSIVNSRFGTLVSTMHTVTMALLGTCAVSGALRWRPRMVARYVVVTTGLLVAVTGGTRLVAGAILGHGDPFTDPLGSMRVAVQADATVLRAATALDAAPPRGDRLAAIKERGTLRVGYLPDALPYAFFNARDELVGFDVALAHRLAIELGVRLAFVPIERGAIDRADGATQLLRQGSCDLIVGGMAVTTSRAGLMQLSPSYLDETLGFVVIDGVRRRFATWDGIRAAGALTLAVPDVPYYADKLRALLPQAMILPVQTTDALFGPAAVTADARVLPAERGAAWTLRHPQYSVVVPTPGTIKVPLAWAMPRDEPALASFVDTWMDLKRRDGTIDDLYAYWILGRITTAPQPRWSIIRDVLHWVGSPAPNGPGSPRPAS